MPETWGELRLRYGLGADPYAPDDNIAAGAAYLRELHDRYGEGGFLAAYNAGSGRYEDHLITGKPLPLETLSYVATVASAIGLATVEGAVDVGAAAFSWTYAALLVQTSAVAERSRPSSTAQIPGGLGGGLAQGRTALPPHSDGLFTKTTGVNRP